MIEALVVYGCAVGIFALGVTIGLWSRRRQADDYEADITALTTRVRELEGGAPHD